MKKILGLSFSAVLVAGGLVFGSAAAATATVEECVPVEGVAAWTETIPAVTNQVQHPAEYKTVTVTPEVQAKPAVYEIEYEFAHKKDPYKTKWSTNPNWNAENNENSQGWSATGNTRNGKLISEEVKYQPAVTKQELVKDAWTETVIVTPEKKIEHPAVEAVTCDDEEPPVVTPETKTLKWLLPNGGTPDNVTWPQPVFDAQTIPCGETVWVQVDVYPYTSESDKTRTDALDDDGFLLQGEDYGWAKSWTFEQYSAPDCEVPPTAANPTATVTAVCGSATVILTNPLVNDADQLTASFVVFVDGEYYAAYSAEAGGRVEETIEFGEDTGDHKVEVFQAGTSEWKLIAEGTVTSDCKVPPTTPEEPEEPTTPTTPTTPEKPVTPVVKVVSAPVAAEQLAQTGLDLPVFPIALVATVMLGGGAWLLAMGLRRRKVEVDSAE